MVCVSSGIEFQEQMQGLLHSLETRGCVQFVHILFFFSQTPTAYM